MAAPLTSYQRRLFALLGVATFFEGYDFIALTQILPSLRAEMNLDQAGAGALVAFVNFGTILAVFLVRKADAWGRRRVLSLTIAGYTIASLLSALSPNVWLFAIAQLAARVFLIGEWAVSTIYAAEEFPAERRGFVVGVIQAFSSLGATACPGIVPLLLQTPIGWRAVYVVGAVPLVLVAIARRTLKETARFAAGGPAAAPSFLRIVRSPYRKRMLQLALIWCLTYVCTQNAVTFWKEFAMAERGFTDAEVAGSISLAAIASMPMVFAAGKLLDVLGRRGGATIIFILTAVGVFGSYTLVGRWPLTGSLVLSIFGASAVLPVLNAYTTELFPTELRGDAFAWSNNVLGRIGYVTSPLIVGFAAVDVGWGAAVRATAPFPLVALALILWLLPETRGRELEDTSRL